MNKFIDLCAGIGGFRIGFESYGNECVLTCEIDKFCKKTYTENFFDNFFYQDIKQLDEKNIEDFNILCAGFPCQSFSLAGQQKGFSDVRGTIFFDIVRILNYKQPECFLLENVKNLKSHDKGNTFKVISKNLDDLNYWHETFLINAEYFVPQKRERVYIVGLRKDKFTKEEFLIVVEKIKLEYSKQKNKSKPKIKDILEKTVDAKYTLSDKLWGFLQKHANRHKQKGNGFGFGLIDPYKDITTRTITARYYKDGSEILIKQKNKNPRKLTPRECARLMGYPDNYKIVVSDTQAYKQFGNSVVVPVIQMFAKVLTQELDN
jgi:DNA (cytosine-5)-methyltransferase 1